MGILDELAKRRQGLIEDAKLWTELAVNRAFELVRRLLRTVLLLPARDAGGGRRAGGGGGYAPAASAARGAAPLAGQQQRAPLQRSKSAHVNIVSSSDAEGHAVHCGGWVRGWGLAMLRRHAYC